MSDYVIAATKDWNISAFHRFSPTLPGTWHLVSDPEELSVDFLQKVEPEYIFFPHWSWIVPEAVYSRWDCVCFHASDVPYGRGGSPIQNLIIRGHQQTKLTALKMEHDLDAGPVYGKRDLSLTGSAQHIFNTMAVIVWDMIAHITDTRPTPVPQQGEAVVFARRTPKQSQLPETADQVTLYNHIRMLDADSYPRAFLPHGEGILEFDQAEQTEKGLVARVRYIPKIPKTE